MSENGVMDRPRRTTRSSLASSNVGPPQTPSSSSNPYKKPTYFSSSRQSTGGSDTATSRNTNGTPVSSSRGRRGRGRPPGSGTRGSISTRGAHIQHHHHHTKPECIAVRVDGRRNTGGSNASSGGGGKRGAVSGGRRSTYNSRQDYEYHYGSDFESDQNDSEPEEELESEQESEADSVSVGGGREDHAESDSDFSVSSSRTTSSRLPSPPVPIWLDADKVPEQKLDLPSSSEDLILSREHVVKAVEIYEPLRRFYNLVRLSPYRFEDFCGALACEDHSALLAEIHIQLLKCVIREEDANGTLFGSNEVKDSVQAVVYFVDHITWPESLRSYLESDPSLKDVHDAITSVEYPFCGPAVRIKILGWLVDQLLTTSSVREQLLGEGSILHEDHCRACNRLGELICCERCPAVYHLQCITPPLKDPDNPPDDWKCPVCMKHLVSGVNDCASEVEKMGLLIRHERLGYDRHGRKYWFLVRRILVESEDGSEVWYFSTRGQVKELLQRLDADTYESSLVSNIKGIEEEIYRQMEVTEDVTRTQNTQRRKTYLEVENGESDVAEQERVTRLKSTGLYKLGQEGLFKSYVNQFATDPSALSKTKHNEERDRKRHLSHKFSLTTASECKWGIKDIVGCSRTTQIAALRAALTHMENVLPTTLMHVNWPMLRKSWLNLIQTGASAIDFSKAMIMISACIRNTVYNPVWSESTGHVRLIRMSLTEREEKKKAEKRDKKDKDDEEDRLKLLPQFVKYTLPIKHQVYKQKGEEYRIHGRWGWIWLSNMRLCKSRDCRELGLLAGPHKHVIQVKNETGKVKTMLIDPSVYCKLMAKRNLATTSVRQPSSTTIENGSPTKDGDVNSESSNNSGVATTKTSSHSGTDTNKNEKGEFKGSTSDGDDVKVEEQEYEKKNYVQNSEKQENRDKAETSEFSIETEVTTGKKEDEPSIEPKVEPMDVDDNVEEQQTNGEVEKDTEPKGINLKDGLEQEINKKDEVMEVDMQQNSSTVTGTTDKEPKFQSAIVATEESGVNGNVEKEEESSTDPKMNTTDRQEGSKNSLEVGEGLSSTDESQNITSPAPTSTMQPEISKNCEDSQGRKFKTELVNVSSGLASAHRILYPKVARRCDYLDNLLHRRLTLMSYEEKQLRSTHGEEMVTKAKPGLAAFEEEEEQIKKEAEEYPGEEIIDENLTLAGAYTFSCYSSECRKEAKLFVKTKGKNRDRLYEKICYSPMCRLKFCLQETTRFKQDRIKEVEKEKYIKVYKQIEESRVYTLEDTSAKLYMKKLPDGLTSVGGEKKKKRTPPIKYPQTSSFEYATSAKPSIFILPQFELKKLARTAGRSFTPAGFFPNQKSGSWGWSYPCGRPVFRTAWQYKTSHVHSLAAAAMQLRIFYASIRWDDILAKIPNTEGKHQVHTDTEIITTEILNHRIVGRFMERVQYLRKMMVVPIDAPKTIREITPSRIGLRKRKRAESPDKTEPVVSEDWVDEEKLELWEIRYYGDRIDRKHDRKSETNTPSTRTKSGIMIKQPEKFDPSHNATPSTSTSISSPSSNASAEKKTVESSSDAVDKTIDSVVQNIAKTDKPERGNKVVSAVKTAELMRETIETEMKMQRAVHLSKRDSHAKQSNGNGSITKTPVPPQPTASQQLQQQKAGITTNPRNIAQVTVSTPTSSKVGAAVVGKKFFVNKQSNVASSTSGGSQSGGSDIQPITTAGILSRKPMQNTVTISKGAGGNIIVKNTPIQNPAPTIATATPTSASTNINTQVTTPQLPPMAQPQKLSVVRMPDGRLQVRGLLPGQHCYQTADGKIHVTVPASQVAGQVQAQATNKIQVAPPTTAESASVTPIQQPQQQTQTTVIVQGGSTPVTTTSQQPVSSLMTTSSIVVTSASQAPPQVQPTTVQQVLSSQPLINISNPAMKTAITTSTTAKPSVSVQQQPQQIIVQQQGGQQVIIQGASAQALLQQQQQKLQRIVHTSIPAQVVKQLSTITTAGKSPVVTMSSDNTLVTSTTTSSLSNSSTGQITVPGKIVIQDGKALIISSSGSTSQHQISEQFLQQQRKLIVSKQMVQSSSPQTMMRPQVLHTTTHQGQIIPGQPLQIIQSVGGQQLHLITQSAQPMAISQTENGTSGNAGGAVKAVSGIAQTTTSSSVTASSPMSRVSIAEHLSTQATHSTQVVKHVLADGRTVLLSPQQLTDLAGGGRKVIINKPLVMPGTSAIRSQQQIIHTGGVNLATVGNQPTIQIVQGPGGHQFLIQQPASQTIIQQAQQQQQQVQIVVPSGQLSGQPLLVKKFVKTTTGNAITQFTKSGTAGGGGILQIGAAAQNQLTQLLGANKLVRLDNNQMTTIQIPATTAAGNSAPHKSSVVTTSTVNSPQQQTTITRTPGLPISIVSPSKAKVQQHTPQKPGTVQVISSSSGGTTVFSSPIANSSSTSSAVNAQQVTPNKGMSTAPTVVKVSGPAVIKAGTGSASSAAKSVVTPPASSPRTIISSTSIPQQKAQAVVASPITTASSPLQKQVSVAPTSSPINTVVISHNQSKAPASNNPAAALHQTISNQPTPPAVAVTALVVPPTSVITSGPAVAKSPSNTVPIPSSMMIASTNVVSSSISTLSTVVSQSPQRPKSPVKAITTATASKPQLPCPAQAVTIASGNPTASQPVTTSSTPIKSSGKSTPNKIVAQIFQTPQGPKVVIQGVSPGELTHAQMMQLQTQIQKQLAAQQQQSQKSSSPTKATNLFEAPRAPPNTSPAVNSNTTSNGSTTSSLMPSASVFKAVEATPSVFVSSPIPASASELAALDEQESSPQVLRSISSPVLARSAPQAVMSPAKVLSTTPNLPTMASPSLQPSTPVNSNKQVVRKQDLVAAVSSVTEPALLSPALVSSLSSLQSCNIPQAGEASSPITSGAVLAKKSAPRKSPLKNLIDPSMSPPPPVVINNNITVSNSSSPVGLCQSLTAEQHDLLQEKRNALKQDIMEKKKAAATQLKLEAQAQREREMQEKAKSTELVKVEEQKRLVTEQEARRIDAAHGHGRGSKKRKSNEVENAQSHRNSDSAPTSRRRLKLKGARTKRKLFCVCKTPYDKDKFYIGCDKCGNWFHGDCIGITSAIADAMSEYICDDCRDDKLYCFCRKPYNDSQFYIQCDKCEEWFHGRCVGVVQGESDTIGDYSCPTCEPNSEINFPNSKRLDGTDYKSISLLVKEMVQHRASNPFRKPVTKAQAPNYFSVIKDPMDLQTISIRVEDKQYERILDFIGDVIKIFENCRYFNEPASDIYRNADNLEKFFVQKIWALRQNLNTRLHQVIS